MTMCKQPAGPPDLPNGMPPCGCAPAYSIPASHPYAPLAQAHFALPSHPQPAFLFSLVDADACPESATPRLFRPPAPSVSEQIIHDRRPFTHEDENAGDTRLHPASPGTGHVPPSQAADTIFIRTQRPQRPKTPGGGFGFFFRKFPPHPRRLFQLLAGSRAMPLVVIVVQRRGRRGAGSGPRTAIPNLPSRRM